MTPALMLLAGFLVALALTSAALLLALGQPWSGLNLAPSADGGVLVASADAGGPNPTIPAGSRLIALAAGPDTERLPLVASDLVEEPDTLGTFAAMARFFARQGRLQALRSEGSVHAEIRMPAGRVLTRTLEIAPRRPAADLPPAFWVQLVVGVTGWVIGIWVVSLERRQVAAWLFALAGAGLCLSALPAAIYGTRELALDGSLFALLSHLNFAGALVFGSGMIGLFLRYPRPIASGSMLLAPLLFCGIWVCVDVLRLLPGPALSRYLPIALLMTSIAVLVVAQYRLTRGDPRDQAALRSLGLSVLVGAGGFVLTIIVPPLLGATAVLSQGHAFLFFLLIHAGVAFGILRYRLFDLDEWAFRILYYMAGILMIVLMDAALVFAMSMERIPAFSLSFILVALVYLPFRDALWRRFLAAEAPSRERLFARIVDVALTPPGSSQETRWRRLLTDLFDPLSMEAHSADDAPAIIADGLSLTVPGVRGIPGLELNHARQGRRLFGPRDLALVEELIWMLGHAVESRRAYERGVAEERARIARDMHDNIGAQLLTALHSRNIERKDAMVRESLSDLRDIVNDSAHPCIPLAETLADLRSETAERLAGANLELDWQLKGAMEGAGPVSIGAGEMHALRSVIREAISNVIRHAAARRVRVEILYQDNWLTVCIEDDGKGQDPGRAPAGNGIANMRTRLEGLGGTLEILCPGHGTVVRARFPLDAGRATP